MPNNIKLTTSATPRAGCRNFAEPKGQSGTGHVSREGVIPANAMQVLHGLLAGHPTVYSTNEIPGLWVHAITCSQLGRHHTEKTDWGIGILIEMLARRSEKLGSKCQKSSFVRVHYERFSRFTREKSRKHGCLSRMQTYWSGYATLSS